MNIYLLLIVGVGVAVIIATLLYKSYKAGKEIAELESKSQKIDNLYIAKKIRKNTKADDYDKYEN